MAFALGSTSAVVNAIVVFNEQVVAHLKHTGDLAAVSDALNAVLQRMKAAP